MPRLSVSLTTPMYSRLSSLAVQQNDSISNIINQLVHIGMQHLEAPQTKTPDLAEQHCQQLIIQMNALIKNLAAELLKFKPQDFEELKQAALGKYHELLN